MAGEPMPVALVAEGELMLRAIVDDFLDFAQFRLIVARDVRLAPLTGDLQLQWIADAPWQRWAECVSRADLVLPIAPETGGALERLSRMAIESGCALIGCRADAVALASSKLATAERLAAHGLDVPHTVHLGENPPPAGEGWVVKPDDGAGSEDVFLIRTGAELEQMRRHLIGRKFVVQPFVPGDPMSLSLLCGASGARVLACNRQVRQRDGRRLMQIGTTVNAAAERREDFAGVAQSIVRAIPGLRGYVGVDFIDTLSGPVIIEVNPRLTTAYAGLSRSLGVNAAELLVEACLQDRITEIALGDEVHEVAGHA